MRVRCADKKRDGSENKTFTGVMTVMNEYKSIADNGADEADRVRTSGQINLFRSNNNGNEIVSYTSNFFNRIKPNQDYEPKAEFEIEMYIKSLVPEMNKDGEETGRYKIVGWIPTYNGIEPLDLIVPEELADIVTNTYEPKQTARFYGEIVQNVTYETIERPMAFGVKKETKANLVVLLLMMQQIRMKLLRVEIRFLIIQIQFRQLLRKEIDELKKSRISLRQILLIIQNLLVLVEEELWVGNKIWIKIL